MGRSAIVPASATRDALVELGGRIATARLRRGWRQADLAAKAGVHTQTIKKIEAGAAGTAVGAYASALWALGLLSHLSAVASPEADTEGRVLAAARLGRRARPGAALDDDF